jgi:hypothetical protein
VNELGEVKPPSLTVCFEAVSMDAWECIFSLNWQAENSTKNLPNSGAG